VNTRLWDVRSALLTTFKGVVPRDVEVIDGPLTASTPPKAFVLVGSDGGEDGYGARDDGASVRQRRSKLGPGGWRDEDGAVVCSVWAWDGNRRFDRLRVKVRELVDLCEAAVAADRSLDGLLTTPPAGAELTELAFREDQFTKAAVVRATFTIAYTAVLTT
jgi:hypothetical protein